MGGDGYRLSSTHFIDEEMGLRGEARGQLASVVETGCEPRPLIQA